MITYKVKARLGENNSSGEVEIKEIENSFQDLNNPIVARKNAYSRYESYLEILGESNDLEENLDSHINKFSQRTPVQIGKIKRTLPSNKEQFGVNLYFILDKDFQNIKKDQEYLIIGDQEERSYLTRAENLTAEMDYYKQKEYDHQEWTVTIKYYNYESNVENEAVITEVLFTPLTKTKQRTNSGKAGILSLPWVIFKS